MLRQTNKIEITALSFGVPSASLEAPAKIRNPEPRRGPGDCQQTQPEQRVFQPTRNRRFHPRRNHSRFGLACPAQHAEIAIGVSDVLPALRDSDGRARSGSAEPRLRSNCLEQQGVAALLPGVASQDEIDDLFLVRQGVLPALQTGRCKGPYPLGMLLSACCAEVQRLSP